MNGAGLATLVAVAGVTYDEVHNFGRMPCPARYVYVLALFGGIGVVLGSQPRLAAAVAWALVIAMVIGRDSPFVQGVTRRNTEPSGQRAGRRHRRPERGTA